MGAMAELNPELAGSGGGAKEHVRAQKWNKGTTAVPVVVESAGKVVGTGGVV